MSYTYKGTKITGTSVTPVKKEKSGIKNAKKGETYFNTDTGHIYKCTEGGKPKDAKWKYWKTGIAHKPRVSVSGLGAPVRQSGNHKMKATWKIPSSMVNPNKGDRATSLDIRWYLGIKGTDPKEVIHTSNENRTESTINLNNLKIGRKTYTRESFYPFKNKPKLNYVTVKVVSKNSKGAGASAKNTRKFKKPRKPTISAFSFNTVGELSCTINTNAGDDYRERYDTKYTMKVYYSSTKKTSTIHDDSTTATSKTIKFDDPDYASRAYGEYAKVTVTAKARGYKGDSATVTDTFYVAYPAKAEITSVSASGRTSSDKCTIYIDTHSTKEHPVDRVKLEYLPNSEYSKASLIPGDAGWETTDVIDDDKCNALAMPVADLLPDPGKYTWIRLKTYHANETVLFRYSDPFRVKKLETPAATAADDKIKIVSATAGEDGQSAVVQIGWDDGATESTGTELSWDNDETAWKSTKEPATFEFEWEDETEQGAPIPVTSGGITYPHSATISIKDLDEGEQYFIKARRYLEDETTTYSKYSNSATVITSEKPESVGASADRYVPKGSGLNVYWTFSGNGLQKEWQIIDSNGAFLANGEGSLGSTQIDANVLESKAENGDVKFTVQVSTGSGWVESEQHTVTIIEPPELAITGNSLVHAHEEEERDFSGDIVTFDPLEDEYVKSLKVPLEPVQDLHGYDKPWVGGSHYNQWDEVVEFGRIDASTGALVTATDRIRSKNPIYINDNNTYYLYCGKLVGTSSSNIYAYWYGANDSYLGSTYASNTTLTPPQGAIYMRLMLGGAYGTTYLNDVSVNYPSTVTTYSPWENLCPITGWTGCEVSQSPYEQTEKHTITGKNIYNAPNDEARVLVPCHIAKNTQITVSADESCTGAAIRYFDADKVQIDFCTSLGTVADGRRYKTFTTLNTKDCEYVEFYGSGPFSDLMVALGTDYAYEPYGNHYPVSWQTEAGTVYGGTVDVVSGVLTATTVMENASDLVVSMAGTSDVNKKRALITTTYQPKNVLATEVGNNLLCNVLPSKTANATYAKTEGISYGGTGKCVYAYVDSLQTVSAWETFAEDNNMVFTYELATPQTYQLDPVQVALLIGEQNNIWNNIGETNLTLSRVVLDEDQLQTNNLSVTFQSNKICDVRLIVASQGAVSQFPKGILRQTEGDTIYSNLYDTVEWTASYVLTEDETVQDKRYYSYDDNVYNVVAPDGTENPSEENWYEETGFFNTTIALPPALDFWDKASYTVTAVGIDRQTSLQSNEVELSFPVSWAHQAPSIEPLETYTLSADTTVLDNKNYYVYDSETQTYTAVETQGNENPSSEGWYEVTTTRYITVTPVDYTDDNGTHHLSAEINLTPPPNYESDDVYDIYRMTGDGAQLIGQSFPLTYTAVDEYAPFGEDVTGNYRIAIRTVDGDVEFTDVEYVLEYDGIRLDWAGGYIEYPYGVSIGDSYEKDVDIRHHMNGSVNGYWNQGVERKGSLNTDAIKIIQQDDIDLTRKLARYAGAVFVRTREGTAFEADVQITDLSTKNKAIMSIAIDATEIELTDEFMLPIPFNLENEG